MCGILKECDNKRIHSVSKTDNGVDDKNVKQGKQIQFERGSVSLVRTNDWSSIMGDFSLINLPPGG